MLDLATCMAVFNSLDTEFTASDISSSVTMFEAKLMPSKSSVYFEIAISPFLFTSSKI